MIQRTLSGQDPVPIHAFEVTPELLREWAARLEAKVVVTIPGQVIRMPIASNTELFYNPVDKLRFQEGRPNATVPA